MPSPFRLALTLCTLLLAACSAMDEPVPADTLSQLNGSWQQVDGNARVQFYKDETVKLTLPDETPPLKLLSALETMKDNQIGFSIGDRWTGPIRVEPAADWQSIRLVFPGKPERTLTFSRSR